MQTNFVKVRSRIGAKIPGVLLDMIKKTARKQDAIGTKIRTKIQDVFDGRHFPMHDIRDAL